MVTRVRIFFLLQSIIALNWVLSKLTLVLAHESVVQLMKMDPDNEFVHKTIVIKDQNCYLDNCFEEDGNGRTSLSMWKYRIKAED